MKYLMVILSLMLFATSAEAEMVGGYVKKNGTYVAPSYRTKADSSLYNNYSTKGNVNPYSGKKGYKPAIKSPTVKSRPVKAKRF